MLVGHTFIECPMRSSLKSLSFDHPYEGKISGELLAELRQGERSVVDYSLEFRTLEASSGWNEAALLVMFR